MAEKRSAFMLFLDTSETSGTEKYEQVGNGVTELTVSYNPQTTTEQYINQDSANTEITGYQPNAPVTAQVVKEDPAFKHINTIRKKLPTMSGAYSNIVMVDVFETAAEGKYPATKQPVSIQIDSWGGAAADPLSISYTLNWRGSGVDGTFDPKTKTFTESAAAPAAQSMSINPTKIDSVEV